jgi:sortase A
VARTLARALVVTVGGVALLVGVWAIVVWRWQDPFTALYTHFEQTRLTRAYERRAAAFRPRLARRTAVTEQRSVAVEARAYRRSLRPGDPVGRILIERINVNMILVEGRGSALRKGPGHEPFTGLPGEGRLVGVLGRRSTYLAPFAAIDRLRSGDGVTIDVPYGSFIYRVARRVVVGSGDPPSPRPAAGEVLRLVAGHPRLFPSGDIVVDARLVEVVPRGGPPFKPVAAPVKRSKGT